MNIKIKEKIKQINNQPEHIRMRYVWGCVAVSMFIIFIVWIFSIFSMFTNKQGVPADNSNLADTQEQIQNLEEQASTLKSLGDQSVNATNEDATKQQNAASSVSPSQGNIDSEVPQSSSYSNVYNPDASTSDQPSANTSIQPSTQTQQ
jgi:predicted PurR-regulated permease PerM